MKVTVHNLGTIKKAEIDLKPLTIFVGPNNAGKTWLAYTLAGIFGPYGFTKYLKAYEEEGLPRAYYPLDNAVEQALNSGSATIDLIQFTQEFAETYFNNVANFAKSWMPEFMSTQTASFEHLRISVDLAETKTAILEQVLNYSLRSEISGGQQKPLLSIRKRKGESKLYVYTFTEYASSEDTSREDQIAEPLPSDFIKELLVQSVLQLIHRALYPHVYVLPTERTTFITFPFGNRTQGNGLSRIGEATLQERKMKAMIGPVNYFLSMVTNTLDDKSEARRQRADFAKNTPKIKEYIQLAQLLEKHILGGSVKSSQLASELELDPAREVLFQPTKDSNLEVSIASSMVKELSPLVLYLRYLARPGELLIIDEPEMNLHPEAQTKMIEFLAMLVNAGLNVLITTHSPYVLDHLTNLIKATEVEDKEGIRREFYLKRTDAFISKDKVSVYLVDGGQVRKAIDEDGVIQWNTFGEVSDRISEIFFKL